MDWNNALLESAVWIAKAYVITLIAGAAVVVLLARYTAWGRQFRLLAANYFSPRRSWRPLITLAIILLLTLCAVRLEVLFSSWYNTMYTALQALDASGFWTAMILFGILATVHVLRSLLDFYMQQAFTIRWRTWLNNQLLDRWMGHQAYYRSQYLHAPVDNPDQRIQQDVTTFVEMSLSLSMGVVNALVSTIAFTLILWNLSGEIVIGSLEIPRGMVFLVFAYVLIATVFAIKIGRPLILLNFLNERFSADYRYALVRMREYSESIAFYAGEAVEKTLLRNRFANVISNAWAIVFRSLKFLGFNFSVSQAAVVFPLIIQAQRFFSQQITLGDLMQTSQAFGRLQDNLSFFRNAYDNFATYRATLDRLSGFMRAIDDAAALPEPRVNDTGEARLQVQDLTVRHPAGGVLIQNLNLEIAPETPLLIRGPSGAGKTTLLRAIAGLWPYCDGTINRPQSRSLFLSQKPYLPLGSLRNALYYPQYLPDPASAAPDTDPEALTRAAEASAQGAPSNLDQLVTSQVSSVGASTDDSARSVHGDYEASRNGTLPTDAEARSVLAAVQLGHLADRLDDVADWSRILSLGEQQRLAFGRLLLGKPQAAFLDEATSAMDEGLEDAMYRLVRQHLPETVLVSVGHRSTLYIHHPYQLVLSGDGSGHWELAQK